MQYLKNEALDTILPDWKGNPHDGKEFQYLGKSFRPDIKIIMRMAVTPNPQRREKREDQWRPSIHTDTSYIDSGKDFISWLGHASFLMRINGKLLLTDPVFYNLAVLKRFVPIPLQLSELASLDYLLISHDHRDHCDKKSIKNILQYAQPKILTSLKMSNVISKWVGNTKIQEAGWYQRYQTKDVEIIYLPAQHWCRRGLMDFNKVLWGSFIIRTADYCIYFGGDSATGSHFEEIGRLFPNIDVAILGIGAYKPDFMMQDVHTSPDEAFEAFQQLGAKKMIPMHYGTYDLSNEPISEPLSLLKKAFAAADITDRLLPLGIGEPFLF